MRSLSLVLPLAVVACGASVPPSSPAPVAPAIAPAPSASAPKATEPRATEPLGLDVAPAAAACEVGGAGVPEGPLRLSLDGRPVASVFARFDRIAMQLPEGSAVGTVQLRSSSVDLAAEIALADVALRPRTELVQDGWLRVHGLRVKGVHGASVEGVVEVPSFIKPRTPVKLDLACGALTVEQGPSPAPAQETASLREGARTTLRASRGGPIVADIVVPAAKPARPAAKARTEKEKRLAMLEGLSLLGSPSLEVLAREGEEVHVRFPGPHQSVEGWIDARVLGPSYGPGGSGTSRRTAETSKDTRCRSPQVLMVVTTTGARRVGVIHPGTPFDARQSGEERWLVHRAGTVALGGGLFETRQPALFIEGPLPPDCATE